SRPARGASPPRISRKRASRRRISAVCWPPSTPKSRSEMSRKNVEDIYSLSPMQQGMLFHTLYEGDPGAYFVQYQATLQGELDAPAFLRAFQAVVDRNPILRTAFVWE